MATDESERALIEGVLGRPFADATQAVWGFTNRTDIVTPGFGDRVVVQRYRRRQDAEYRDAGLEGPRFPAIARLTGELLASFRRLPTAGLELDDRWADPGRLVARASRWVQQIPGLAATERTALAGLLGRLPALFAKRPVVLAHGDFAPGTC